MNSVEELNILKNIEDCEKNIEACKSVIKNLEETLYQEKQFLIIYKNRLKKMNK